MIKKQLYEAPATEVLELKLEGNVLQVVSNPDSWNNENIDDD